MNSVRERCPEAQTSRPATRRAGHARAAARRGRAGRATLAGASRCTGRPTWRRRSLPPSHTRRDRQREPATPSRPTRVARHLARRPTHHRGRGSRVGRLHRPHRPAPRTARRPTARAGSRPATRRPGGVPRLATAHAPAPRRPNLARRPPGPRSQCRRAVHTRVSRRPPTGTPAADRHCSCRPTAVHRPHRDVTTQPTRDARIPRRRHGRTGPPPRVDHHELASPRRARTSHRPDRPISNRSPTGRPTQSETVREVLAEFRTLAGPLIRREDRTIAEIDRLEAEADPVSRLEARCNRLGQRQRLDLTPDERSAVTTELVEIRSQLREARHERQVNKAFDRYTTARWDEARAARIATVRHDILTEPPQWILDELHRRDIAGELTQAVAGALAHEFIATALGAEGHDGPVPESTAEPPVGARPSSCPDAIAPA